MLKEFLLAAVLTCTPFIAYAASFDCSKAATKVEKMICSNEELSSADEKLSQTYKAALASTKDKVSLKQKQRNWLKERSGFTDLMALLTFYHERIRVFESISANSVDVPQTAATVTTPETKMNKSVSKGALLKTTVDSNPVRGNSQSATEKTKNDGKRVLAAPKRIPYVSAKPIAIFLNSIGMSFVKVPSGSFIMGTKQNCQEPDPFTSRDAYDKCMSQANLNELPAHRVTFSNDFWIGQYEVTQEQWYKIMGNNPSIFKSDKVGEDSRTFPVENVSWEDIQEFINRLNAKENRKYRLPTEAEWEYACRSGGKAQEYCGRYDVDDMAWYNENNFYSSESNRTHRVGTKRPNDLGIYDMSGNVWERCSDWYGLDYYGTSPEDNPQGPTIQDVEEGLEVAVIKKTAKKKKSKPVVKVTKTPSRVMRGGSAGNSAEEVRSTARTSWQSVITSNPRQRIIGFRLAISDENVNRKDVEKADDK